MCVQLALEQHMCGCGIASDKPYDCPFAPSRYTSPKQLSESDANKTGFVAVRSFQELDDAAKRKLERAKVRARRKHDAMVETARDMEKPAIDGGYAFRYEPRTWVARVTQQPVWS